MSPVVRATKARGAGRVVITRELDSQYHLEKKARQQGTVKPQNFIYHINKYDERDVVLHDEIDEDIYALIGKGYIKAIRRF